MRINKKYWFLLLLPLLARVAHAEPYFAVQMGLKCSACHVNPTGGGMRTTFGSLWGQTMLPANTPKMTEAPFTGEISRYFALGANLRADATVADTPDTPSRNSFDVSSLRIVRKSLVIEVVDEPGCSPELHILAKARGIGAHGRLDGQHMLAEGLRLGPLVDQPQGLGAGRFRHSTETNQV